MPRVLIVSPHFPPVNAPDMQRARTSLPHFREFGWEPHVLAVAPVEGEPFDPLLAETVPSDVAVDRVRSLPPAISRRFGVGNVALRALPFLYRAGRDLLRAGAVDLVYFSTTMFLCVPLGRVWKRRFGIPFVVDMQDPWLTDYYETHPSAAPPRKYGVARRLHAVLEPWTLKEVDGLISVSPAYVDDLRSRYAWLSDTPSAVVPFGVSSADLLFVEQRPQPNRAFRRGDGLWHAVFTGAAGDYMAPALEQLFQALRRGLETAPHEFGRVRLHFVGTGYEEAAGGRTVSAAAAACGIGTVVEEMPSRVPYFEALQIVRDADCLLLVGSDDPAYAASKLNLYLVASATLDKPMVAVVEEASVMRPALEPAAAAFSTFKSRSDADSDAVSNLTAAWLSILRGARRSAGGSTAEPVSAREGTRQQCALFNRVLANRLARATAA